MTASPLARPPIASRRAVLLAGMFASVFRYAKKRLAESGGLTGWGGAVQHSGAHFVNRIRFRYPKKSRCARGVMKIGSQAQRSSAISASNAETIVVRGHDLCSELVGVISFTDHAWLLVTGQLPTAAQRRALDATLVAIAEHGLVPSVAASRMTLAAAPEALQGAVAAGILGCGSVILGSAESAARLFADIVVRRGGEGPEAAARAVLAELRAARKPVPGYGHPLHKRQDPRVARLLAVATEAGIAGKHIQIAELVERLMPEIWNRPLAMNVSGAIA